MRVVMEMEISRPSGCRVENGVMSLMTVTDLEERINKLIQ